MNSLKIAKSLIDGITYNKTDAQIVKAIIFMAKAMDVVTIAEGAEEEEQFRILESLGCDEMQGYYLGRPLSAQDFGKAYLL